MKILYLSWFNSGEGSQVHATEFVNGMNEIGHEVIPIELSLRKGQAPTKKGGSPSTQPFYKSLIRELKSIFMNIPRLFRFMKLIGLHKPDCIINRYSIYDLSPIIVGKFYRIPIVSEVNGSVIFERDLIKKFYFKGLAKWVEKTIFKQANVVTVVSTGLYDYFEEHEYDVSSTIVIPNGVDIEKFKLDSPAPIILENIVAKWEGKTILGFLGSLKSWHGVERIIDILPILINENKDVRFLIIGDGSERERLEKKINDLELSSYVHITGFLDYKDIPGAINIMDIALAPYHSIDHFHFSPLKVFEYMGMGKPVISPNLGQCSELIETDVNGVLIEENTNEALIQAIVDLVNNENKRKLLGKNAREFIAENYTWKVNAEKISKAIKLKQ